MCTLRKLDGLTVLALLSNKAFSALGLLTHLIILKTILARNLPDEARVRFRFDHVGTESATTVHLNKGSTVMIIGVAGSYHFYAAPAPFSALLVKTCYCKFFKIKILNLNLKYFYISIYYT
jgi:hypothetical protein